LVTNDHQWLPMVTNVAGSESGSGSGNKAEAKAEAVVAPEREADPPSLGILKTEWLARIGVLPFSDIAAFKDFASTVPLAWFMAAIDETAKGRHPSWALCSAILTSCRNEQRPPSSIRKHDKPVTRPSLRYEEVPA
jgi:hypothetical protein